MMEYVILLADSPDQLYLLIQEKMENGWEMRGKPRIKPEMDIVTRKESYKYWIAMALYANTED